MTNKKSITGHVAKVLNSRQLVINKGQEHGVKIGMTFIVYDQKGENIKDPKTGQNLGSVKRPKVSVKIIEVEPKLAVAETFRSERVNIGGSGIGGNLIGIAKMFEPPKYIERFKTLKTNEQTWEDLDEAQSYVKIGDPVEQEIRDKIKNTNTK